jgi:hypothetical protein
MLCGADCSVPHDGDVTDRRHLGLTQLTLACLALAALIGGCSGTTANQGGDAHGVGGTSTPNSSADVSGTSPVGDPASARAAEVLAMQQTDQNAALVDAGLELELAVAKESGLEAELGGPDGARAALVSAWAPIVAQAAAVKGNIVPLGFRRRTPTAPSLGEGFFGGYMIAALAADAAVSASANLKSGPPVSETKDGLTLTGSQNYGELAMDATNLDDKTGVTTKLVTKTSVVPCPDADGRFEAEAVIDVTVSKGSSGQHGVLDVKVVGHVDDEAHLTSSDLDYTMKWSRTSGGGTELVDVSASMPSSGGASRTVKRSGGAATSDLEASATLGAQMFAMLMEHFLTDAAQRGWESGRCVQLDVKAEPGKDSVKPGGTSEITAAPRSAIDGGKVGGNVTATMVGELTLEPNGSPVPADAGFVYTAPTDNLPKNAKVSLESRSRRGVGKAEIVFQIFKVGYVASGSGDQVTFSGNVSDPELFFTVLGDFQGGTATFDFSADRTDDGDLLPTGTITITGGGSDAKITGDGTYTLVANQDGTLTVTMKTHACVDVSGQCRDSTDVITLTPNT